MANGFPSVFDLTTLDGANGFEIVGVEDDDNIGNAVSEAGDINGDGIADLIIGSSGDGFFGGAYVLLGRAAGFGSTFNLSDLNGDNGFFLEGTSAFYYLFLTAVPVASSTGFSVDSLGDFNGDGFDDIAIGAPGGGAPETFVVYGGDEPFPAAIDLDDDLNGGRGFEIEEPSDEDFDLFGNSTSGIGDINGDGIADVVVGSPGIVGEKPEEPGAAYVIFGSTTAFPAEFDTLLLDGSNGFRLIGTFEGEEVGQSVSGAGDINGDGIDDLVIGAPSSDVAALGTRSYVVFGSRNGFPASIALATLTGADGFAIAGLDSTDEFGTFVSRIGDINADGLDDIAIGAPGADANGIDSGAVYVVFGSQAGFPALLDLASLDGNNGFAIAGLAAGDELGDAIAQAGDLNDDGIDDFVLGAPNADANGADSGQAYVVFGSSEGFTAQFDLNTLDGDTGFIVNGLEAGVNLGDGVSGIGDFNNDGVDDLALGAPDDRILNPGAEDLVNNQAAGASYVIYGRASTPAIVGDDTDNVLTGTDEAETFEAGAGDDRIDAGAGDDTIAPGPGNDTIDGGAGVDTVEFTGDRATFPIQIQGESLRVGSNSDTLTNVEKLAFDDITLDVADLRSQLVRVELGAAISISLPQPVSTDALNLYSGPTTDAASDIVLSASNGAVIPGSVAIDAAGKTLDFVPANGPLPADTYTLTLASRADGFAKNGTLLDGDGDGEVGGDFQQTFTVEAPAAYVVGLPDLTRGPGHTVTTFEPDTRTQVFGLPLSLNNGADIDRVEFAIAYDPALLQVSGVAADSLPTGWSVESENIDAVSGLASATLAGPTLTAGEIELARLEATVPETARYGNLGLLSFSTLSLNGGAIAASGDAAIQVVSKLGDVDASDTYTANDALEIAQMAVELGTGFAAQSLVNPLILGDVTGDGTVSALDAAIVAAQAEGLQPLQLLT